MKTLKHTLAMVLVASCLPAVDGVAVQVLYTAEGDSAPTAADQLTIADGAQDGTFVGGAAVTNDAKFGSSAFSFGPNDGTPDGIDIPDSKSLGSAFTLAAFVRSTATDDKFYRLFSDFLSSYKLIFDFSPTSTTIAHMRFIASGVVTVQADAAAGNYNDGEYHHLAATYDDGVVNLYLDGVNIGSGGTAGKGAVTLGNNLRVGEDLPSSNTDSEQLVGNVDDILVMDYALTGAEVAQLISAGAGVFFEVPLEVEVTTPANGASYEALATIEIAATASHTDGGSVTNVEFYSDGTLIGNNTTSPYGMTWSNVIIGAYSLTARAYGDGGGEKVSDPVAVSVTGTAGVLYTAEDDAGSAVDLLLDDGAQDGVFTNDASPSATNPKFGTKAYVFGTTDPDPDEIIIPDSQALGSEFTLAAFVDSTSLGHQRLFSAYPGAGSVTSDKLVLGFDPDNNTAADLGLRVIVNGVQIKKALPASAIDGAYHHYAVTYSNGAVTLYFDGSVLDTGTAGSGAVTLSENLRVGEDTGGATWVEQLQGDVDDILVLKRALAASEMLQLSTIGAESFLSGVSISVALTSPTEGAEFDAPADISLTATATQTGGGTITGVAFYAGSRLVGWDAGEPFEVTWNDVWPGSYSLTAWAHNDTGQSIASDPVAITVNGDWGILYLGEDDAGNASDQLVEDGEQDGTFYNNVSVSASDPAFGSSAYQFGNHTADANNDKLQLTGTADKDLNSNFTLAAQVKVRSGGRSTAGGQYTRLFSSFRGNSGGESPFLYYDFRFDTGGYRFSFHGNDTVGSISGIIDINDFTADTWHHFAVTYDNGTAVMYFDGVEVATGTDTTPGTNVLNAAGLWFGEDYGSLDPLGSGGGTANDTLDGWADDILVLKRALTADDIEALYTRGAWALLGPPQGTIFKFR